MRYWAIIVITFCMFFFIVFISLLILSITRLLMNYRIERRVEKEAEVIAYEHKQNHEEKTTPEAMAQPVYIERLPQSQIREVVWFHYKNLINQNLTTAFSIKTLHLKFKYWNQSFLSLVALLQAFDELELQSPLSTQLLKTIICVV